MDGSALKDAGVDGLKGLGMRWGDACYIWRLKESWNDGTSSMTWHHEEVTHDMDDC